MQFLEAHSPPAMPGTKVLRVAWLGLAMLMLVGPLANAPALRHTLLAFALLFSIYLVVHDRIVGRRALCFYGPWLALVLLSAIWSPDSRKTLIDATWEVFGPLSGGLLAMYLATRVEKKNPRLPIEALAIASLLATLGALHTHLGIAQSIPGWVVGTYQGLGVGSTVGVLACLVGIWAMQAVPGVGGRATGGLLLLSGLLLGVLGHNRMFWFSLLIGLLPWIYVLSQRPLKRRIAIAGLILAGCVAGVFYSSIVAKSDKQPNVVDVVPALQSSYASDPRWEIWQAWIGIIEDRPVLGYGYGSRIMPIIGREKIPDTLRESKNARQHAHNLFLNVVLQTGLIGLFCFFWMLFGLLRQIQRAAHSLTGTDRHCAIAALSVLLAALAKGLTDDFFWSPANIIMWIFIGLMLGYCKAANDGDPVR